MKVPAVAAIVLCSWGASILIPLTIWSAASRTGPFRRASDEARLAVLAQQPAPLPPQVPGQAPRHVRVVLPDPATDVLGPKHADDVAPAQDAAPAQDVAQAQNVAPAKAPPLSPVIPTSPGASAAADEPASPAPSAQPQQSAQAAQVVVGAAGPPGASTADAVDDRRAESGDEDSRFPIFMRVPQLPTLRDEGFAPRPQPARHREARLRDEFASHRAMHSYHYRRAIVGRRAPANPFVMLARLLFH